MKKLSETIGKIVFYLFVLAVAAWTASLTLSEMKAILPNDPLTPYFALALFDGGALAWLMAWLGHARGLMQRSISVIMLVLDLSGALDRRRANLDRYSPSPCPGGDLWRDRRNPGQPCGYLCFSHYRPRNDGRYRNKHFRRYLIS